MIGEFEPIYFRRWRITIVGLFFAFFFLLHLAPARAADLFFAPEKSAGGDNQFKIGVFLKTAEPLNAVEGKIHFSTDLLELQDVADGDSIINFWIDRPTAVAAGAVSFSGITPGGFTGERGHLFSLGFLIKREGSGVFKITAARALRNDGAGTAADLQTFDAPFVVSKKTAGLPAPVPETKPAAPPPEPFRPQISRDRGVFDGQWFAVFATQDKTSGIDHYEIKESRLGIFSIFQGWTTANSPALLKDQDLRSRIFIKAIDKAGKIRVEELPPRNPLPWYENVEIWSIVVVGLVGIGAVWHYYIWRSKYRGGKNSSA